MKWLVRVGHVEITDKRNFPSMSTRVGTRKLCLWAPSGFFFFSTCLSSNTRGISEIFFFHEHYPLEIFFLKALTSSSALLYRDVHTHTYTHTPIFTPTHAHTYTHTHTHTKKKATAESTLDLWLWQHPLLRNTWQCACALSIVPRGWWVGGERAREWERENLSSR